MWQRRVGILVGGGPAPGINSVIAAAAARAAQLGRQALGIRDGFRWLMQGDTDHTVELGSDVVEASGQRGGSLLGTSRANPTSEPGGLAAVLAALERLGVTELITIGGDDTAYSAACLEAEAGGRLRIAHVPKTIDNDLPLPAGVHTFGYQTARQRGVEIVKDLIADAAATSRWYLVTAMGRRAGHLALGIGRAAGATLTLIPEEFEVAPVALRTVVDTLVGAILKRLSSGRRDGLAVIAEGVFLAMDPRELPQLELAERDEHGHTRSAELDIADLVKRAVRHELACCGVRLTLASKDVGYELRSADPIAFDLEYASDLGCLAVDCALAGASGVVVLDEERGRPSLPFSELRDRAGGRMRLRGVDTASLRYAIARRSMVRLVPADFADPQTLARLAASSGLSAAAFRERFLPLVSPQQPQPMETQVVSAV